MSDASLVTAAKPAVGGAVWVADLGSTLPTDATTELDSTIFTSLGYISEDGLTNNAEIDSENIKAWGGDIVLPVFNSQTDDFTCTFIEALNADLLAFLYGADNVSGTLDKGTLAVKVKPEDKPHKVIVVDMIMKNNALKRVVIPEGAITNIGEVPYTHSGAVGYETTISCIVDESGYTHYEYFSAAETTTEE